MSVKNASRGGLVAGVSPNRARSARSDWRGPIPSKLRSARRVSTMPETSSSSSMIGWGVVRGARAMPARCGGCSDRSVAS